MICSIQLALDIWVMILRSMGDLPEPVVTEPTVTKPVKEKGSSLKKKIYKVFSFRTSKSKFEKEVSTGFGDNNNAQVEISYKNGQEGEGRYFANVFM